MKNKKKKEEELVKKFEEKENVNNLKDKKSF